MSLPVRPRRGWGEPTRGSQPGLPTWNLTPCSRKGRPRGRRAAGGGGPDVSRGDRPGRRGRVRLLQGHEILRAGRVRIAAILTVVTIGIWTQTPLACSSERGDPHRAGRRTETQIVRAAGDFNAKGSTDVAVSPPSGGRPGTCRSWSPLTSGPSTGCDRLCDRSPVTTRATPPWRMTFRFQVSRCAATKVGPPCERRPCQRRGRECKDRRSQGSEPMRLAGDRP